MGMKINELLKHIAKNNASDLHLSSGLQPIMRVDGDLYQIDGEPILHEKDIVNMLKDVLTEAQINLLDKQFEIDLSIVIEEIARFRVNIFHQLRGISVAFRTIPLNVPTLAKLEMPSAFAELCKLPNGLVLITGPTGCGKSTTLAAIIDHINNTRKVHVVTLEDPIEFVHQSRKCLIQQREVHRHTATFEGALRAALREDPDVILVGEMRDLETIRLALTAAETGHLVFATLHTSSAAKSVNRIIDIFPMGEKDLIRSMFSESLQAIISQVLLKRVDGGRIAAHEMMMCTSAIRNLIREDKVPQIYSVIQTSRKMGMYTLEQNLEELVEKGVISDEVADGRIREIQSTGEEKGKSPKK